MTEEQILVVKREKLFDPARRVEGLLCDDLSTYVACIAEHKEFLPRALMETDQTYKQIIPYLVFTYNDLFFLMQRTGSASEVRLRNNYSLGIGGHIRQEDFSGDSIFAWAEREFHEEVNYSGTLSISPIGVLNDDSNDVGRVHAGLVLLLQGDSPEMSIKSELKSGRLVPYQECLQYAADMENWSKILLPYLSPRRH